MNLEDTIVAVSSPPGAAVRGIVRLSGPSAIEIAQSMFTAADGTPLSEASRNSRFEGRVRLEDHLLPACACVFRSPHSYTRQHLVELHLLGSPIVLSMVVETSLAGGARRAEPGEFTARAYLCGAMDLSQVHGIAGMIAAKSDLQLRAAARLLHGHLAETAGRARGELADLLSLVEGALDFADEPIEFIRPDELRDRLLTVRNELENTAAAGLRAERWNELPRVLLTGRPNTGKSSLFNRLTGMDRAICTPIAGTTRDVLSAPLALGDLECLLVDTAGLDAPTDELDAAAQAAARREMEAADLILHVVDPMTVRPAGPTADLKSSAGQSGSRCDVLRVINKCDLLSEADREDLHRRCIRGDESAACFVSASTGEGCEALTAAIRAVLGDRHIDHRDDTIALLTEHRDALDESIEAIERAIRISDRQADSLADAELVATELHTAAAALGKLIGQEDTEALLGRIFARFCVGK